MVIYWTFDPLTHVLATGPIAFDAELSRPMPFNSTTIAPPDAPAEGVYRLLGDVWVDVDPALIPPQAAPAPTPPDYVDLSQNQFFGLASAVAGVTPATIDGLATNASATVRGWYRLYEGARSISCPLDTRDPAAAARTTAGLAIMIGAAAIDEDGRAAIIANWPTA